jgi:hypothetical protein
MATINITAPAPMTVADFKGRVDPDWCPGCGDFGVLAAVQKALVELQIPNHRVATVSGIGCSSNFPGFIETYGMHTLHGRSLPVASGLKMANHDMTVLVTGGDGDGFGIGCGHFVHAMRRNINLTYIVMDNQIYGLTTGQTSPTSRIGMKTKSNPYGNMDSPVNPITLALSAGATFVARGFSASRSTSPSCSSRPSPTRAFPSSTSSAPASPTTRTTPSSGSVRASRSSKKTPPTTPPTGPKPSSAPPSGATRSPSASSSSAPTCPRLRRPSRCSTSAR